MRNHIFTALLFILMQTLFLACDKMDDNGPFEGNWLLTYCSAYPESDNTATHSPVNEEGGQWQTDISVNTPYVIVWSVRNELIQVRNFQTSNYYYFTFTRTDHDLQLEKAFFNDGSNDTLVADYSNAAVGDGLPQDLFIPADGHFTIVTLDSRQMVLEGGGVTLLFKKN